MRFYSIMHNCSIFGTSHSTKGNLKRHQEFVYNEAKYSCQFTWEVSVKNHINNIHKGIKLKCEECGKEFANKTAHIKSVNGQKKVSLFNL